MIFIYIFLFIILLVVIAQSRITILEHLAKEGNSEAQINLGAYYVNTAKDYEKGLYWTQKSIEQGNPKGEIMLGIMYENGYGVEKDISQAMYWYEKAAAKGNADAKKNLKRLNGQ
jgi:TPR repeat protein